MIFFDLMVELAETVSKLEMDEAPGPGIPPDILKLISERSQQYILRIFKKLAKDATFPPL